jgi:hypothetical protein
VRKTRCGAGIVATFIFLIVLASASALPAGIWPTAGMTQSGTPFGVPQWTSLRIRMDDTLTSEYSMEGDPFGATVMDAGDYQGAHVYGTIRTIDNSTRFRGHRTMILAFNRLVTPDGRRAPISAEIVRLYHAPSGEFVDVQGAIESGGRGKNTFIHTGIGAGAGALLGSLAHAQIQSSATTPAQKGADVTKHATGTFEVKVNPEPPEDKAEGSTLGRMSLDKQFHGDIEGTSKGQMLTAGTDVKGSAGYVAIERVTGTLNGRKGSFVLQHSGTMSKGALQMSIIVVPDSGTGELVGLAGKMTIIIAEGKHSYGFEYSLPDTH